MENNTLESVDPSLASLDTQPMDNSQEDTVWHSDELSTANVAATEHSNVESSLSETESVNANPKLDETTLEIEETKREANTWSESVVESDTIVDNMCSNSAIVSLSPENESNTMSETVKSSSPLKQQHQVQHKTSVDREPQDASCKLTHQMSAHEQIELPDVSCPKDIAQIDIKTHPENPAQDLSPPLAAKNRIPRSGFGKHRSTPGIRTSATRISRAEFTADGTHLSSALKPRSPIRKKSPIRWFPRRKSESYLERKIRMLQEKEGGITSLDETLGAVNPPLSRIEREKLAAQNAAAEAINSRKSALVEASWCRILKVASIPCNSAIVELKKAETKASAALVEAEKLGVILHTGPVDRDNTSEAVTASFDTPFDVDKEVTSAIKSALQQLNHSDQPENECNHWTRTSPSSSEAEESESECKATELRAEVQSPSKNSARQEKLKSRQTLISIMLSRITELSEENRVALAAVVATRGLSALLKEQSLEQELNAKSSSTTETVADSQSSTSNLGNILVKHVSKLQREIEECKRKAALEAESKKSCARHKSNYVESLDQVLVKHVSRLEREKQAAQAARRTPPKAQKKVHDAEVPSLEEILKKPEVENEQRKTLSEVTNTSVTTETDTENSKVNRSKRNQDSNQIPDLGSILVKHVSRLEKEKQAALRMQKQTEALKYNKQPETISKASNDPMLTSPKTESEAKNEDPKDTQVYKSIETGSANTTDRQGLNSTTDIQETPLNSCKLNSEQIPDLGSILVKHVSRLEKEKAAATKTQESNTVLSNIKKTRPTSDIGLGDYLVKKLSKLEMEKQKMASTRNEESNSAVKKLHKNRHSSDIGLGDLLVKKLSRLEMEKAKLTETKKAIPEVEKGTAEHEAAECVQKDEMPPNVVRKKSSKEKAIEDEWGGLSLGNSLKRHVSRLELEQAAWKRAEEEARQSSKTR